MWRTSAVAFLLALLAGAGSQALAQSKISGTVVDAAGGPVADVTVRLEAVDSDQPNQATKTKKKGQFFFAMVREGKYRLTAEAPEMRISGIEFHGRDKDGHATFDLSGPTNPGSPLPVFEVGDTDTVTCDLTLARASGGSGTAGTGLPLPGTGDIVDLIQRGNRAEAREAIARSLEATPDDPRFHYLLAFLEVQENHPDAAVVAIDRAIALDPAFPGAHLLRATVLEKKGETAAALVELEEEVRVAGDPQLRRDANIKIAVLARESGRDDQAAAALRRIIEADPGNSVAYAQLIDLYTRGGKDEELEVLLATAPPDVAGDAALHFNIAAAQWNRGESGKAADTLGRALAIDPGLADAHRLLGYCKANLADFVGAVAELERYLELAPGAPDAAEVREFIASLRQKE